MKLLAENDIVKVEFDEDKSLFQHTWNDKTRGMTNEEYKSLVLFVNEALQELPQVLYHLVDTSHFLFAIEPEIQEWASALVFPTVAERNGKKIAFLISSHLFAQVSIEQFTEENQIESIKIKYFHTKEDALQWLWE
jgi:hypothetical protein